MLIWVYSHEGNEWIVKVVDPVRKNITSKLPVGLVHFLSYFASIPLWTFVKIFRGPGVYLRQLAKFRFSHVHSIVFDQLIPSVASYWTKNEALGLLKDLALTNIAITRPESGTGWTVLGVKKSGLLVGAP